jgi:hypothetical protein
MYELVSSHIVEKEVGFTFRFGTSQPLTIHACSMLKILMPRRRGRMEGLVAKIQVSVPNYHEESASAPRVPKTSTGTTLLE